MAAEGCPFSGVLFAGLMITKAGPKTLEFNARFGDPECQVLMARLKSDLLPALIASADGELSHFDLRWHDDAALIVVMAAKGYPGTPQKGTVIDGIAEATKIDGVTVFHAGTKAETRNGKAVIVSNGGRVLGVAGVGKTVAEAQKRAYAGVNAIRWPGGFCRRDIGWRALERERGG
jgi:phosphoribosylamine--glycine ligase